MAKRIKIAREQEGVPVKAQPADPFEVNREVFLAGAAIDNLAETVISQADLDVDRAMRNLFAPPSLAESMNLLASQARPATHYTTMDWAQGVPAIERWETEYNALVDRVMRAEFGRDHSVWQDRLAPRGNTDALQLALQRVYNDFPELRSAGVLYSLVFWGMNENRVAIAGISAPGTDLMIGFRIHQRARSCIQLLSEGSTPNSRRAWGLGELIGWAAAGGRYL